MARVKKIIATDPDIGICSNNAAFVITLATVSPAHPPSANPHSQVSQEMFIQYLANEGQNMAKMDRKPRRNVQYKDLGKLLLFLNLLSERETKLKPAALKQTPSTTTTTSNSSRTSSQRLSPTRRSRTKPQSPARTPERPTRNLRSASPPPTASTAQLLAPLPLLLPCRTTTLTPSLRPRLARLTATST